MVQTFWQETKTWFELLHPNITLNITKNKILFGCQDSSPSSFQNYITICGKNYIWKSKLQLSYLCFPAFKAFLKGKLTDFKGAFSYEENYSEFEKWINLFDSL